MKPPVEAPDIEADQSGRVDPEGVERRRELVAAAADVRRGRRDRDRSSAGRSRSPGLRSSRAASPSPTLTLPARTSACARLRDSTRPRSTSSWSSRTRGAWRSWRSGRGGLTRLSWHSPLHRDSRSRAARRQPAATSERPGRGAQRRRAPRGPGRRGRRASSRSTRRRSATEPWSTNRSPGMPTIRTATSR